MVFSSKGNDLGAREPAIVPVVVGAECVPPVAAAAADRVNAGAAWLAAASAPVYAPYLRKVRRSTPRMPSPGSDPPSMAPPFQEEAEWYDRFAELENCVHQSEPLPI